MANESNLIPFEKGDKRINRGGRPKSFDTLRELAKELGNEESEDNKIKNNIEMILRDWMTSKNFNKQKAFMEYAFGKVPETIEVTQENNKIVVTWKNSEIEENGDNIRS